MTTSNKSKKPMLPTLVTLDELKQMFKAQDVLNKKYNGEQWKENITNGRAEAAFIDECSEFLREIEPYWKWWSGKAQAKVIDINKATFELIDIIHFGLMIVLYRYHLDAVIFTLDDDFEYEPSAFLTNPDDQDDLDKFTTSITSFLKSYRDHICFTVVKRLIDVIEMGGELIGLKPGQIFEAYQKKNELNSKRAAPQKAGTYDKSKEQELSLGD